MIGCRRLILGATLASLFACSSGGNGSPDGSGPNLSDMSTSDPGDMRLDPSRPGVTVTKAGTGTGTVTSQPQGISCGPSCTASFEPGQKLVLTAQVDGGSTFGGWGGACAGADPAASPPTCTLMPTTPVGVTVTFNKRPATSRICTDPNWCWENPLPQGNDVFASWGTSASDLWAVGQRGVILHGDGATWTLSPSGVLRALRGVWGRAANDVWAVGEGGTIVHWDGARWSTQTSGVTEDLYAVWGNTAEVWAVGDGTILRWDGTAWKPRNCTGTGSSQTFHAVWGSSPNDVFAVGTGAGYYCHFNGTAWASEYAPQIQNTLNGLFGIDAKNLWAVGDAGEIDKWNGTGWTRITTGMTGTLSGIWGSSDKNIWAVGEGGLSVLWNGSSWSVVVPQSASPNLQAVWGSSDKDVWAVGARGTLRRWTGAPPWNDAAPGVRTNLLAVWGSSETNTYAVGEGGTLVRWDGTKWSSVDCKLTGKIAAVHGSSDKDVWVGDDGGQLSHWNGTAWTTASLPGASPVTGLYVAAPDSAWALGGYIDIFKWDGTRWALQQNLTWVQYALWGSSDKDIWTVGSSSRGYHFDGSTWSSFSAPGAATLFAIYGVDSKNVWAAGAGGTILRWDGSAWGSAIVGNDPNIIYRGLWGSATNRVFAVGSSGSVNRWDGVSWNASIIAQGDLRAVYGVGPDKLVTVGDSGAILRYRP